MVAAQNKRWTVEEYLAYERESDTRHEYLDGQVYAMVGVSRSHDLIVGNLITALNIQLRERPCEVHSGELRVRVSPRAYFYPDVSVVCGEPDFSEGPPALLLNPTVVIEVLSASTEAFDRGEKGLRYRALPSLREFVLVYQDQPRAEHYFRDEQDSWRVADILGLDGTLTLRSIGCSVSLADAYAKVAFPPGTLVSPAE